MGRTLILIITFNLGLAHHLSAMTTPKPPVTPTTPSEDLPREQQITNASNDKMIRKALQLYEVSENWHSRITASRPLTGHDCDSVSGLQSVRFRMILANNLSHIHCMSSNHAKQKVFLEHLLSTVMVAVDYQKRAYSNSSSISNNSSEESESSLQDISNNSSEESESSLQEEDLCTTRNLEGFMMNASQLFLCHRCADAA